MFKCSDWIAKTIDVSLNLPHPLFLKYAYGNNSELGEFSLASCPRGNKLLQRDGCS